MAEDEALVSNTLVILIIVIIALFAMTMITIHLTRSMYG